MPLQVWTDQQIILVRIEQRFLPRLTRAIEREYKAAVAMVRELGLEVASGKVLDSGIDTELIDILASIYAETGVRMARVAYRETLRKYPVRKPEQKAGGLMGIASSWLAAVRNALNRFALIFVTDISRTTREQILAIFDKAAQEGWSYEKIAQVMLESGMAQRRARVIARTEVHRGGMLGSLEGARSLPYEAQKVWVSGSGNRVRREPRDRFDHVELQGQTRDLEVPFRNEEDIMYPGDPNASKGNSIQCRCVMNYIPKLDSKGNIIMK